MSITKEKSWYVPPVNGEYFMSEDHKAAAIGHAYLELREIKFELQVISMELDSIGTYLQRLGISLKQVPSLVLAEEIKADMLDAERIKNLIARRLKLSARRKELEGFFAPLD